MPSKRPKSDRGPGRPYRGPAYWQRINWVEWVEDRAREYKQADNQQPYHATLIDLLEMTGGVLTAEDVPEVSEDVNAILNDKKRLARIEKNYKKKRHAARRELRTHKRWRQLGNAYYRYGQQRRRLVRQLTALHRGNGVPKSELIEMLYNEFREEIAAEEERVAGIWERIWDKDPPVPPKYK